MAKRIETVEEFLARGGVIDVVTDHTRNKSYKENKFRNNARGVPTYKNEELARQRQGHALGPKQFKWLQKNKEA
jgi:hypothetical protein